VSTFDLYNYMVISPIIHTNTSSEYIGALTLSGTTWRLWIDSSLNLFINIFHLILFSAFIFETLQIGKGARGSVVVKALCYKPEGRGFETRWGEWFLSIYLILLAALGPGVYSASNRNEYQKHKIMLLGSKAWPICRADNFTDICEPIA
jgi:hypothetical protein